MKRFILVAVASIASFAAPAAAHFPFVVPDADGATAKVFMSEVLAPDGEVSVDLLAGAKLYVRTVGEKGDAPLTLTKSGADAMSAALPGDGTRLVHGVADLGVMQRGQQPPHRLVYYPKTVVGDAFDPGAVLGGGVPVEIVPRRAEGGVRLELLVAGKPAGNAEMRVITPDGTQEDFTTGPDGLTTDVFREPGRYGAWARHWVDEAGEVGGKPYKQVRHYATIVFDFAPTETPAGPVPASATQPAAAIVPVDATVAAAAAAGRYPALPQAVASFGAVASDGWLYVYGGHTARRHSYSTDSVSGQFHRLNLARPTAWEPLPGGVAVQGMNLAAHNGNVYRVGGMQPRNAPGAAEDNHSLDLVQRFDPATGTWETLPPLPAPRSSHDVAFVGDELYVVGGWHMKGAGTEPSWVDAMHVLDVSAAESAWRSVPQPFRRRALIAAVSGTKLYAVGGMDGDDKVRPDVDVYDAATRTWSKGPPIPPAGPRDGFAPAACTADGRVYLSVGSGAVYQLSRDGGAWEPFARSTPRIVHRMIPHDGSLLLVGGATRAKMLDLIETLPLTATTAAR